jgi:hypothetical protein
MKEKGLKRVYEDNSDSDLYDCEKPPAHGTYDYIKKKEDRELLERI